MAKVYSKERKQQLIKQYKEGEYESLRAFCRKVNISPGTISGWLKSEGENKATDFALVSSTPLMDKSKSEHSKENISTGNIKMAFAGALIEVPAGFKKQELQKVMEVLGAL